jgi:hypothetical protein
MYTNNWIVGNPGQLLVSENQIGRLCDGNGRNQGKQERQGVVPH